MHYLGILLAIGAAALAIAPLRSALQRREARRTQHFYYHIDIETYTGKIDDWMKKCEELRVANDELLEADNAAMLIIQSDAISNLGVFDQKGQIPHNFWKMHRPRWGTSARPSRGVVRLAACGLPPGHRDRYLEEWQAELNDALADGEPWYQRAAFCLRVSARVPVLTLTLRLRRQRATE